VFTQPHAVGFVLGALDEAVARGDIDGDEVTLDVLEGVLGGFGRRFYGLCEAGKEQGKNREMIRVTRDGAVVAESLVAGQDDSKTAETFEVVPFRAGQKTWGVEWIDNENN